MVVPPGAGNAVEDFALQPLAQRGIGEPPDQRRGSAFVRPGWNDARQIILAGAVGIDIGLYLLPLVARASEERNELGHATPQLVIGDLEVNDVDRDSSSAADLQGLVHGLKDAVPFVPNVGGIDAAVLGGDFAEATRVPVSIQEPGGPLRELATPRAPCSMDCFTRARICASSSAAGGPALGPRT